MAAMGAIGAAMKDCVVTFLWMLCSSMLPAATTYVTAAFGLHGTAATLGVLAALLAALLFPFNLLCEALGGACFNPTALAANYAARIGDESLLSMAIRFPAQAAGAVGGVLAIMVVMPLQYKHTLGGPSLKVDVHTGAAAEGILTFVITFIVLCIMVKGPRNAVIQTWLLSITTVCLIVVGDAYTGPSMNPANAFGWAYVYSQHDTWGQFYVYWVCPFVGAILAGWIFRAVFPPPAAKVKKA